MPNLSEEINCRKREIKTNSELENIQQFSNEQTIIAMIITIMKEADDFRNVKTSTPV
jgi:hypothetical protein